MYGPMHCIYYIKILIATKVLNNSTQRICLVASGGREPVTFRSLSPTFSRYSTHVDIILFVLLKNIQQHLFELQVQYL